MNGFMEYEISLHLKSEVGYQVTLKTEDLCKIKRSEHSSSYPILMIQREPALQKKLQTIYPKQVVDVLRKESTNKSISQLLFYLEKEGVNYIFALHRRFENEYTLFRRGGEWSKENETRKTAKKFVEDILVTLENDSKFRLLLLTGQVKLTISELLKNDFYGIGVLK